MVVTGALLDADDSDSDCEDCVCSAGSVGGGCCERPGSVTGVVDVDAGVVVVEVAVVDEDGNVGAVVVAVWRATAAGRSVT